MAIPKIDEQNIMAAIKYIDEHGIPDKDKSTQYVLVTEEESNIFEICSCGCKLSC